MEFKDKSLSGILRSLVSDEYCAWMQYYFSKIIAKGKALNHSEKLFEDTGKDELDDHFNKLVTWMQSNEIPVPTDFDVIQNLANTRYIPLPDPSDTRSMVEMFIKNEKDAIEAYTQAMGEDIIKRYPDLIVIFGEICADERVHLKELEDLKTSILGESNIDRNQIPTVSTDVNTETLDDDLNVKITNFCKKIGDKFGIKES